MDVLTRDDWGAQLALGPPMRLPAQGIHVHHTVTTPTSDPAADMRQIERIGGARFGRLSYSWALHPSGIVGDGAGLTIGAHTAAWNSTTFGIALIGNYELAHPTAAQIEAFRQLRHHLAATGRLTPGHFVAPHRARKATACPGRHTMARWPDLLAPPTANPQEPDMLIVDCRGRPALVLGVGGVKQLNKAQRDALRAVGAPAKLVGTATSDALASLVDQAVDPNAVADAVAERLPDLHVTRDTLRAAIVDALVDLAARPAA